MIISLYKVPICTHHIVSYNNNPPAKSKLILFHQFFLSVPLWLVFKFSSVRMWHLFVVHVNSVKHQIDWHENSKDDKQIKNNNLNSSSSWFPGLGFVTNWQCSLFVFSFEFLLPNILPELFYIRSSIRLSAPHLGGTFLHRWITTLCLQFFDPDRKSVV